MEDRKVKRRSPRTSTSGGGGLPGSGRKNSSSSGGRHLGNVGGTNSSQKGKGRRAVKDKARCQSGSGSKPNPGQTAPIVQHSFLTDVSDVQEMEKGLLSLLNDFHSGKLQAFGNECSIDQMEQVQEMQGKLARLHFDLFGELDEMPEDQRKMASDKNLENLLLNLEELSSSIQKLNLADSPEVPRTASV